MLDKAFIEMREKGYFAKRNFSCCQSCGWADLSDEEAEKAVFTHRQDEEMLEDSGVTYICWSGDGQEIYNILTKNGLEVSWDGSDDTRMKISI